MKGAQRLVIELKDRLRAVARDHVDEQPSETVRAALVSLGWSSRDADKAIAAVVAASADDIDVPHLLRASLQHLDRR
jgi:Holliday junction DNA helicase RuvA